MKLHEILEHNDPEEQARRPSTDAELRKKADRLEQLRDENSQPDPPSWDYYRRKVNSGNIPLK